MSAGQRVQAREGHVVHRVRGVALRRRETVDREVIRDLVEVHADGGQTQHGADHSAFSGATAQQRALARGSDFHERACLDCAR